MSAGPFRALVVWWNQSVSAWAKPLMGLPANSWQGRCKPAQSMA